MSYVVGDDVFVETTFRDDDGVLIDPTTVILTVTDPEGMVTTPTVDNPSLGRFTASVPTDSVGSWLYYWHATDPKEWITVGQFETVSLDNQRKLVVSLADFKQFVNITTALRDDEMMLYLEAATDMVETQVGKLTSTEYIERVQARNSYLRATYRPVISVDDITPVYLGNTLGPAVATDEFYLDPVTGSIKLYFWLAAEYEITYHAGWVEIPSAMRMAGLVIAEHLWKTQNGRGGRPVPGEEDEYIRMMGLGFALPNRALELLRPFSMNSIIGGIA